MQLLTKAMSHFMCRDYSGQKFSKNLYLVDENIHCSAVTLNTKDYILYLFKDILQISMKKIENIFIKVDELKLNIGS